MKVQEALKHKNILKMSKEKKRNMGGKIRYICLSEVLLSLI